MNHPSLLSKNKAMCNKTIFSAQTLKNLPQFRDKPHEEVRHYLLEKKEVDIGSNFNWNGLIITILVVSGIITGRYGLYLMIKHLQKIRDIVTSIETY